MNIMLNMEEGTFEQIEETTELTELQELKAMLVDIKKDLDMIKDYLVGEKLFQYYRAETDECKKGIRLLSPLEEDVNGRYKKRAIRGDFDHE